MSVDEGRRLLMEMLPPTGWADVATRRQFDALEERLELRMDIRLERWARRMIRWNVATLIAMTGIFAAITRLG